VYRLSKTFRFSAAHVLEGLDDPRHPCGRVHGHNYEITLSLSSSTLDGSGFVADTRRLDFVRSFIADCLDHQNLNETLPELRGQTTGENIASHLYQWVQDHSPESGDRSVQALLSSVRVCETPTVCVEYQR